MITEFWFLASGLLLVRALTLRKERFIGLLVGTALVFFFFRFHWLLLIFGILTVAVHGAYVLAIRRRPEKSTVLGARIASGIAVLIIANMLCSPGVGTQFGAVARGPAEFLGEFFYLSAMLDPEMRYHIWLYLAAALYGCFETNYIVALVLNALRIEPVTSATESEPSKTDDQELRRGWIIGILERVLIIAFTIGESVAAIGLIMAAKGFARFRQLDNREFAEYVLVGTLLSASLAVGVGLVARYYTV